MSDVTTEQMRWHYATLLAEKDARIAELEAKVARVEALAEEWMTDGLMLGYTYTVGVRRALTGETP